MAIIRAVQNLTPKAMIDKTTPFPADPRDAELARLRTEVESLQAQLKEAVRIINEYGAPTKIVVTKDNQDILIDLMSPWGRARLDAATKEPGHE